MNSVKIIGVLNVTPDSYYDGGKYQEGEDAVRRAGEMLHEGADVIEIGGESTGPGSKAVSLEEELNRTLPLIRQIRKNVPDASLSIDTAKAAVAREALKEGVVMLNDVTAGRGDLQMFSVLKDTPCSVVLMYAKDPSPRTMITEVQYEDVLGHIKNFLGRRKEAALSAGIEEHRIILDPGMGHFISSDPTYSFEVLAHLEEFLKLGSPILLSPSRKSFLSGSEKLPPFDRLPGTIVASAIATLKGASYIRTHDVKDVRRGCEIAEGIRSEMKTGKRSDRVLL